MTIPASPPADEALRLQLLRDMDLLDTDQERAFDDLAQLAAYICGTPIALVSLVDAERQWFKARVGTEVVETSRAVSICAHAILNVGDLLVVPDLAGDPRFNQAPYMLGETEVRFYAGMPLDTGEGHALGSLCVLDTVPRQLTPAQCDALRTLAAAVMARIALRRRLARATGFFTGFAQNSPSPLWIKDRAGAYVMANDALLAVYGMRLDELIGQRDVDFLPASVCAPWLARDQQVLAQRLPVQAIDTTMDGKRHWLVNIFPIEVEGQLYVGGGAVECTADIEQQRALARHDAFYQLLSRLTSLISRATTVEALCLDACRMTSQFFGIEAVDMRRVEPGTGELRLLVSVEANGSVRDWSDAAVQDESAWYGASLAQAALASGHMAYSNHLHGMPLQRPVASYMAMPLFVNQQKWGVLSLYSPLHDRFDAFARDRSSEISNEISFGLERLVNASELHRLARHHPHTGLPNRLHFEERLAARIAAGQRGKVLVINVERLDDINSAYGGAAMLCLLKLVADRLGSLLAERMCLSNIGPGRFAVFLCDDERIDIGSFLGSAILPLVRGAYQVEQQKIWCTVSAGVAQLPEDGNSTDALLVKAWEALSGARSRGDDYAVYDRGIDQVQAQRMSIEAELRDAIARREFVNHYQPKVDMLSGAINGAEALVRWQHPTRGLVAPAEFIPLLESSGMIIEVGRLVLNQAMQDWREWAEAGLAPPQIAVNVAPLQFRSPALLLDIANALDIAGVGAQPLSIEITETSLVSDHGQVVETLRAIRAMQVPVAIDDFGTGYSSLAYLVTLPLDVLKIDRSFVKQMRSTPGYMGLVSTIITLAHNLGLKVVAEGIELEEDAQLIRQLHCEQGQGYLYGRPVPAEQFADLLRAAAPERARRVV